MFAEQMEQDVACVYGWYARNTEEYKKEYSALKLPKVPLLLTTLVADQEKHAKDILTQEGWLKVGWYPSCHDELDKAARVTLYYKEQDEQPRPVPQQRYPPAGFNIQVPLGCSCNPYKTRVKLTVNYDRHRTLGVHRHITPTPRKTVNNWHRFAVTPLASYWFWGLLPDETDRHKYE